MSSLNILSDVDTVATYDFTTLCIDFFELNSNIVERIKNKKSIVLSQNIIELAEIYESHRLINHEYQHFLDATSTLWGVKFLKQMHEAYEVRNIPQNLNPEFTEYFKAKLFYKNFLSIKYPKYYSLQHPEVVIDKNWQLRPTIGKAFDHQGKPSDFTILFARYFNSKNETFARTPVSLVTLLECSAVIQEIYTTLDYIKLIKDPQVRKIHNDKLDKYFADTLYNRELTEYSSCFHLVANKIRCPFGVKILNICEVLIEISLNCTDEHFDKLTHLKFDTKSTEFNENIIKGLKSRNRGVLFFLLNYIAINKVYNSKKEVIRDLDKILNSIGLSYSKIMRDAEDEIRGLLASIKHKADNNFIKISESALYNFIKLYRANYFENKYNIFHKLEFPKALFYEDGEYAIFYENNNIGSLDPIEMNQIFTEAFNWCKEFSKACFI
ncbi:hypothetical protein [Acinetobacter sp. SFA]|uniref:hypothetical protein n=1 Tax=Acinetobacter sp. SFA TaxID=1805633 RepID=UPI0007D0A3DD|nr:hypothetical protein [Acinetobacter sp. SFA]OAL78203.1 hypothetical protein AY607_06940 [Acinetobacter sp. SFA]